MKTYKINNVEISEEELRKVIKDNPELVEEENKSKYFTPKYGEEYFFVNRFFGAKKEKNEATSADKCLINVGVHRTKEEAELDSSKQLALVRMWNYADSKMFFRPDWSNYEQDKCHIRYDHLKNKFTCDYWNWLQDNFMLPYFKSLEDCEQFIKDNQKDLELFIK